MTEPIAATRARQIASTVLPHPIGSPDRDRALQPIRLLGQTERERLAQVVEEFAGDVGTVRSLENDIIVGLGRLQRGRVAGWLLGRPDPSLIQAAVVELVATLGAVGAVRSEQFADVGEDLAERRDVLADLVAMPGSEGVDVVEAAGPPLADVDQALAVVAAAQVQLALMAESRQRLDVAVSDWDALESTSRQIQVLADACAKLERSTS